MKLRYDILKFCQEFIELDIFILKIICAITSKRILDRDAAFFRYTQCNRCLDILRSFTLNFC